jgi:hypothetical protein
MLYNIVDQGIHVIKLGKRGKEISLYNHFVFIDLCLVAIEKNV